MAAEAIDSYKLLTTLKATGKDANYSAEELANAFRVAQEGADLLTRAQFESRMEVVDERFKTIDARFDALETKFEARFSEMDSKFEARFGEMDSKFGSLESKFGSLETKFDSKFDFLRADIKAEVKASQLQNLLWLSGIILASNGAVIALLARVTHLF